MPPPLSPTLQTPCFSPASPTPPAPAALLPRPLPQEGVRARAYIRGAAVSGVEPVGRRVLGFSEISPCTGPWWLCATANRGGGPQGGGLPPPLSPTLPEPHPLSSGAGACVTIFNRRQCPVPPGFSPYSGPWWTPRVAGPRQALSGRTAFHHLHHDCAGGCPSGSEIAWRK